MRMRGFAAVMLSVGIVVAGTAFGETYPDKPIRMLSSTAGGATDFAARIVAQGLSTSLGEQVVVDNRPAIVSNEIASKAPSDGYTLLVAGGALWITPLLQRVSYDPVKDFSPITFTGRSPAVLLVNPSLAVKSVGDLIALAKAKPGTLNFGTGATGGPPHLAGELFKIMAGVNVVRVPYKGGAPAIAALLSSEVQMMFGTASSVPAGLVKSGKLKALAVTSLKPSSLFPNLPTMSDSGLPGYEVVSLDAVLAPAHTSSAIVERLHREIVRIINSQDVKQKLFDSGIEVVGTSPAETARYIHSDMTKWSKVIKDAGINRK